jgi:hypothetical protein
VAGNVWQAVPRAPRRRARRGTRGRWKDGRWLGTFGRAWRATAAAAAAGPATMTRRAGLRRRWPRAWRAPCPEMGTRRHHPCVPCSARCVVSTAIANRNWKWFQAASADRPTCRPAFSTHFRKLRRCSVVWPHTTPHVLAPEDKIVPYVRLVKLVNALPHRRVARRLCLTRSSSRGSLSTNLCGGRKHEVEVRWPPTPPWPTPPTTSPSAA